ncbi:MAG TPA: LacI family transcriptional regulator [Alphaproteobacteria bacterium]|nr:LacI family transcriptional regulator [Alphaproteobacteria bacterium]
MKKRKPSMRDVAHKANVSVSAVSLVVRNKPGVSDDTRARVWDAITELGYTVADPQTNGRTAVVGLLIERGSMPAILDIFYGEVIRGFQAEAQRLGYQVLLHMFARGEERFDHMLTTLANDVQGFVIANDGDITAEMIAQAEATRLPLVLIENYVPGHRLPCVIGDNFIAGHTVTQHLLSLGHTAVALLRGPSRYSSLTDRLHGCMAAVAEAGILVPPAWLPPPSEGPFQRGYLQMREILKLPSRPTAVVAVHDKIAFGALEAIREAGLRIPEDIALASIDDVAESAHTRPPLTTFHIPRAEMGILAMQKLERLITNEPEIAVKSIVYGHLVVRESCGAAVASGAAARMPHPVDSGVHNG